MRVIYEVNVGGGCCQGETFVPDDATEEEVKAAILDILYDVRIKTEPEDAKLEDIMR